MSTSVWLDCDPGHDDALALILAAHTPGLRLVGVSTVFGNQSLPKTTRNALRTLHVTGVLGVPVVPGAAKPLLRPGRTCAEIHGESGLDGHALPDGPQLAARDVAITRVAAAVRAGAVLVCTGPLTNAALLLSVFPELAASMRLVLMGGSMGAGNTSPCAEWNIELDPEAASIVFNSGADVTMVPLQVTHTALVTPSILCRINTPTTPFRTLISGLLLFFAESYAREFAFLDGPPLHDPCAVALVLAPQLFTVKRMRVDVECTSPLSAGQTVVGSPGLAPNLNVAVAMDVDAFWEIMLAAVARADALSPLNVEDVTAGLQTRI